MKIKTKFNTGDVVKFIYPDEKKESEGVILEGSIEFRGGYVESECYNIIFRGSVYYNFDAELLELKL